jgi:hypothetical protein
VSGDQNADQNRDIKIGNRSFENVSQFEYLGTTVIDHSFVQEEIKRRMNSRNGCYHSVQKLLSSYLFSKNIKIIIYKTVTLPVVLYECETLREEHKLRVFENRVLRRIFGLKRNEMKGGWRKLHNEELHDLYSSPNIMTVIKLRRRMRLAGHVA